MDEDNEENLGSDCSSSNLNRCDSISDILLEEFRISSNLDGGPFNHKVLDVLETPTENSLKQEYHLLYTKCLLKTICHSDLLNEMGKHFIESNKNDSYPTLCLRTRLHLLKAANIQTELQEKIEQELRSGEGCKYKCSLVGCHFSSNNHRFYVRHLEFYHRHMSSGFCCNFSNQCFRVFQSIKMLKKHIRERHGRKVGLVSQSLEQRAERLCTIKCEKASCGFKRVHTVDKLRLHLYEHLSKKEDVKCPYCPHFSTNIKSTFAMHLSRRHEVQNISSLRQNFIETEEIYQETNIPVEDDNRNHYDPEVVPNHEEFGYEEIDEEDENGENEEIDEHELFVKSLANSINTWMNVKNIGTGLIKDVPTPFKMQSL